MITAHIRSHLETYGLIYSNQHGFLKRRHCESQLLMTTHDFLARLDKKHTVDIAVLDFSKVFDSVPLKRLLRKLLLYGIEGRNLTGYLVFSITVPKVLLLMGSVPTLVVLSKGIQLYQVCRKAQYWGFCCSYCL